MDAMLGGIPPMYAKRVELIMQEIDLKSGQRRWQEATDNCFDICVGELHHREMNEREINCFKTCTDKFYHLHARCLRVYAQSDGKMQQRQMEFMSEYASKVAGMGGDESLDAVQAMMDSAKE
jgi:hypothetical protein